MESIRRKQFKTSAISPKIVGIAAIVALIIALIIWGCISTTRASNIHEKYAASRRTIGEELYGVLYMMALEYDDADLAGADVEGEIIPSMSNYYARAQALNSAITSAYGNDYAVLDDELISDLDGAFDAYDDAFDSGHSTDDANALMTVAIANVRQTLSERYDEDAHIIAR